ncbi:YcbK family protein [Mesorhizobium sp. A556]
MPGYAEGVAGSVDPSGVTADSAATQTLSPQTLMTAEGDAELPAQVAYLPTTNPSAGFPVVAPASAVEIAGSTPQALEADAKAPAATTSADIAASQPVPQESKPAAATDDPVYATASEMPKPETSAPKKKGFFASLFGTSQAHAKPAPIVETSPAREAVKPVITLASADAGDEPIVNTNEIVHASMNGALPGVRQTALFEIKRKSGIDDESDVDLNEDEGTGLYHLASAAGLARLAPNGLLKQTEGVDVACLKPSLVRVLKTIERHYGKKMIVTSGYRDPSRNRRANGARNSLHMYCAAADIQIPGVSKWELANYARAMPGRGGVGTYCHTKSVHVDVGPERDWNWRCRRRN